MRDETRRNWLKSIKFPLTPGRMGFMKKYINLQDLVVYQLARELSDLGWKVYETLNWRDKNIMGDQFISSIDSVGANIAEGYRRYHRLDKIKFYYNSRGSLSEAVGHWLDLLQKRGKAEQNLAEEIRMVSDELSLKLENFIAATYKMAAN